jgi:CheY-like chemotaxis protein
MSDPRSAAAEGPAGGGGAGHRRILVVDDDPDIVDYVRAFLEDHGYEVTTANASTSALQVLEREAVDLVIVDVLMPGRSGLDLLVTLRNDARFRELPIVVLTGSDGVLADGARSYQGLGARGVRGPDHVLGKPLQTHELLGTLERLGV